jgi:chromosome segregation ATPase
MIAASIGNDKNKGEMDDRPISAFQAFSPAREKRRLLEVKAQELGSQLGAAIHNSSAKMTELNDLVEKLASTEFRLEEATRVADASVSRAELAEKEKNTFKNTSYDLGARLTALKKRLVEQDEEATEMSAKNLEQASTITELRTDMESNEKYLNKSYNDTLGGLTSVIQEHETQIVELTMENRQYASKQTEARRLCTYLEDKVNSTESQRKAEVSELTFKLTEANRVNKFMEDKLHTVAAEKKEVDETAADLQDQVKLLDSNLRLREQMLVTQEENHKNRVSELATTADRVVEMQGKLAASRKVAVFLEGSLSKAESLIRKGGPSPETEAHIASLKESLNESHSLIDKLNDGLSIAAQRQVTMEEKVNNLEEHVRELKAEATTKNQAIQVIQASEETIQSQAQQNQGLTEQNHGLTEQNHGLTEQNHGLTEQNHGLTERNQELTEQVLTLKKVTEAAIQKMHDAQAEKDATTKELERKVQAREETIQEEVEQKRELTTQALKLKKVAEAAIQKMREAHAEKEAITKKFESETAESKPELSTSYVSDGHSVNQEHDDGTRERLAQLEDEQKQWEQKCEDVEIQLDAMQSMYYEQEQTLIKLQEAEMTRELDIEGIDKIEGNTEANTEASQVGILTVLRARFFSRKGAVGIALITCVLYVAFTAPRKSVSKNARISEVITRVVAGSPAGNETFANLDMEVGEGDYTTLEGEADVDEAGEFVPSPGRRLALVKQGLATGKEKLVVVADKSKEFVGHAWHGIGHELGNIVGEMRSMGEDEFLSFQ